MNEVIEPPKKKVRKEEQLYKPVMDALKRELEKYVGYGGTVHLEITV